MATFIERLMRAIESKRSVVCVGLDPVIDQLPAEVRARHHEPVRAMVEFCTGIIDATSEHCAILKPQSACFERFGSKGIAALEEVVAHARMRDQLVLLDAKRGDIGISATHYAVAATHLGADAITVNGYLGETSMEPYITAGLGVFVLVRTSNPDSDSVQSNRLMDGRTVAELMADMVANLGGKICPGNRLSNIGCVVGATKAADAIALRARMPNQVFLVPGYGAQGGTAADIRQMLRHRANSLSEAGVIVNASRSIIFAKSSGTETWQEAVRRATVTMNSDLSTLVA